MKPIFVTLASAIALTFAVAATTAHAQPGPLSITAADGPDWIDMPQTAGTWTYGPANGGTIASFAETGGEPGFAIVCTIASHRVALVRYASGMIAEATMTIRTETANRFLAVQPAADANSASAILAATDPLLDAIALARGRFAVELDGVPALYLPNWAEVTRVIEDCR
jgi:hypothetical protein